MAPKIGRNDPCSCGSGKKYKNCCFQKSKPASIRGFKAKVIKSSSTPSEGNQGPDLIARAFQNQSQKHEEDPFEKKSEKSEKSD